jgi:hypothetical protein
MLPFPPVVTFPKITAEPGARDGPPLDDPPADPEQVWTLQAQDAAREINRCRRLRATIRSEKARTALRRWEMAEEDYVTRYHFQFNESPPSAIYGLRRTAAGCRYLIQWHEHLKDRLIHEGTWLGNDRLMAIQLLGQSAALERLNVCEDAYNLWVDCLAAQDNPRRGDIEMILRPEFIPLKYRANDAVLWPRDREASQARLHALTDRKLNELYALEARLRAEQEAPARAAAVDLALAKSDKDDQALLREQRSHERSFQQAAEALRKLQGRTAGSKGGLTVAGPEPGLLAPRPCAGAGTSGSAPTRRQRVAGASAFLRELPAETWTPAKGEAEDPAPSAQTEAASAFEGAAGLFGGALQKEVKLPQVVGAAVVGQEVST